MRIKSQLERAAAHPAVSGEQLTFGDLVLDSRARLVTVSGEPVALTAMGYQILEYLMRHPGEAVSKDTLLREVWSYVDPVGGHNMVEAAIKRLRHELGDDSHDPRFIKTVWGVGYRFG